MSQEFFYLDGDNQKGPVSKEQLKSVVKPDTFVWSEGMADWKQAKDVTDLKAVLNKPPAIPAIDKAIPSSSMMKLVYGAIAAGVITAGTLLYVNSNSDSSSSDSSFFSNIFGSSIEKDAKKLVDLAWKCMGLSDALDHIDDYMDFAMALLDAMSFDAPECIEMGIFNDKMEVKYSKRSNEFQVLLQKEIMNRFNLKNLFQ